MTASHHHRRFLSKNSHRLLAEARNRRLQVWMACKKLADQAATDNRPFTAEEQRAWDALNNKMDNLDKLITALACGWRPGRGLS